ncbi:MAG: chaperone NapD [Chromatiaceae bacterium]|nr:chaperone NapD [Chromatiaceae bacterium]MCW5587128.1 chaperone NapD [Chromatiales bacterium]HPE81463.1 chaperone NapD [Gammaproteobacteria bacterium]MCP5415389.1 chaperone NapD [Chromatiaceae bacterium]MCP5431509.1 chaperone NapD [Chromatiaceae bacterium]
MNEYHVCGVLLMSRPEHSARVEHALSAIPGVELHANDGGRMVVTVEGPEYGRCGDIISQLATLDGVASSSLVYHQIDNESLPEESVQ